MKRILLKLLTLFLISASLLVNSTNSYYSSQTDITANTFTLGYWLPPTLVYPPNNTIATLGSDWTSNPYMSWEFVKHGPNVRYIYESSHTDQVNSETGAFTHPVYVSALLPDTFIPAPDTPNGIYYWHVKAVVDDTHHTPWSQLWSLVVDNTRSQTPDIVINQVLFDTPLDGSFGTDVKNEWVELYNNTSLPISLKNWSLVSNIATHTIRANISIPAHGFAYLSHDHSTWNYWDRESNSVSINLGGKPQSWLGHSGSLKLKNPAGKIIDSVSWNDFDNWDLTAQAGETIARIIDGDDTYNDARDWKNVPHFPKITGFSLSSNVTTSPAGIVAQLVSAEFGHFTLTVSQLPPDYSKYQAYDYEIIYMGKNMVEKGIFGRIDPTLVVDNTFTTQIFLGTCSGSVCIPDLAIPIDINLNIYNGNKLLIENQPLNP